MREAHVVLLVSREWSFTGNLTICADLLMEVFHVPRGFVSALEFWAVVSRNTVSEVCVLPSYYLW